MNTITITMTGLDYKKLMEDHDQNELRIAAIKAEVGEDNSNNLSAACVPLFQQLKDGI